ncbi:unnamed protein product [Cuscuta epithymum]|uniref:Pectin acetylesterase n=1 Tax=Cuscuta epithymum TaxID=186058 RepID=A0AAV0C9P9_9ASTE|nr:unnamed protein product [Cuscuta epithymum]
MAGVLVFSFWMVIAFTATTTIAESRPVHLKYVNGSMEKGAVCLDGSPSAYYHDQGFGPGRHNWVIYLQGGGWCTDATECKDRSKSDLGTSNHLEKSITFNSSYLSSNSTDNPEFHSWNRVYIPYCDGSSFTGNVEAVDPVTNVTYRGLRIFKATMDDLLSQGMKDAQDAILSGVSAGGLATMIHCDRFRDLLPMTARVKCLAIASYFVHEVHLNGSKKFEFYFEALVSLHGSSKGLPPQCTSRMSPSLCFFPQYFLPTIETPVFISMSAFDHIQVRLNLFQADEVCLLHDNCTFERLQAMQELRHYVLSELPKGYFFERGIWITSCIAHNIPYYWNQTSYAQVFRDWYINGGSVQLIDEFDIPRNCSLQGIRPNS